MANVARLTTEETCHFDQFDSLIYVNGSKNLKSGFSTSSKNKINIATGIEKIIKYTGLTKEEIEKL